MWRQPHFYGTRDKEVDLGRRWSSMATFIEDLRGVHCANQERQTLHFQSKSILKESIWDGTWNRSSDLKFSHLGRIPFKSMVSLQETMLPRLPTVSYRNVVPTPGWPESRSIPWGGTGMPTAGCGLARVQNLSNDSGHFDFFLWPRVSLSILHWNKDQSYTPSPDATHVEPTALAIFIYLWPSISFLFLHWSKSFFYSL